MIRAFSGLGGRVVAAIQLRAARKRLTASGPIGDFYRGGGDSQLYSDLHLCQDDLVIDAGGYKGEWTAGILTRYGCRSELFEPVPTFAEYCRTLYQFNDRVRVHQAALGGSNRTTAFSLADNGTSEFRGAAESDSFSAEVRAISDLLSALDTAGDLQPGPGAVGVLKLNIEGGEYEVLENLLETDAIDRIRCLLIQFHRQPQDWEARYQCIVSRLRKTHAPAWRYPMVWEKWLRAIV